MWLRGRFGPTLRVFHYPEVYYDSLHSVGMNRTEFIHPIGIREMQMDALSAFKGRGTTSILYNSRLTLNASLNARKWSKVPLSVDGVMICADTR